MNGKRVYKVVTLLLFGCLLIGNALAVNTREWDDLLLNEAYSIPCDAGSLEMTAIGTKGNSATAKTVATSVSDYSCTLEAIVYRYHGATKYDMTRTIDAVAAGGSVHTQTITRYSSQYGDRYEHIGVRYGVSNPSYANSYNKADEVVGKVYQYDY